MYRNRKRSYHKPLIVSSTDPSIYKLFNSIRHNTLSVKDFEVELNKVCVSQNTSPEGLLFQNSSLFFYSTIYENEKIFSYLLDTYPTLFNQDILKSIYYIYPNKNPEILSKALTHFPINQSDDITEFLNRVSKNCYRDENVSIISQWIEKNYNAKNINDEQLNQFFENLIINKNKSFLSESCKNSFFKTNIISNLKKHEEFIHSNQLSDFFIYIIKKEHANTNTDSNNNEVYDLRQFMHMGGGKETQTNNEFSSNKEKSTKEKATTKKEKQDSSNQPIEINQPTIIMKKKIKLN